MRFRGKTLPALLAMLLAGASARGAEPDYRALLRDHEGRLQTIRDGAKALPRLFEITADKDPALAADAERTIRWIAVRANDTPAQREAAVKVLLDTAAKAETPAARRLAVCALAICGQDEVAEPLVAMLKDEVLGSTALETLIQIPGSAATKALADAFAKAEGESRVALGKALATRRDPGAVALVATMFDDQALREAAFESLVNTRGVAADKEMVEIIGKAEPPLRARLLRALGERGSPLVLDAAKKLVSDKDEAVRIAALEALGRVDDLSVAPTLLEAAEVDDPATRAAALTACRRVATFALREGKAEEAAKMLAHVLAHTLTDLDRIAALGGLAMAKQPSTVPAIEPFLQKGDPSVRVAAANTLHAIPGDKATAAIRQGLKVDDPRVRQALLRALAERVDPAAVPDIVALVSDPNEDVQVAALRALAAIPSVKVEPTLLAAIEKGSQPVKSAAADAYLALGNAVLAGSDSTKALAIFHKILELPMGPPQWTAALQGVERLACRHSEAAVERHLASGNATVRDAAARAYMAIATTIAAEGNSQAAADMFTRVLHLKPAAQCSPEAVHKLRAIGAQVDVPARDGIVSAWWLIGAWPTGQKDWAKAQFPETEINLLKTYPINGKPERWRPVDTNDPHGTMTLNRVFDLKGDAVAYAYAEIQMPMAQDVVLEVGGGDGATMWLNGREIHDRLEPRLYAIDQDKVKARLKKGQNRLLVKTCEGTGTWAFHVRVKDEDGKPVAFKMR